MINFLAQVEPANFWTAASGTPGLYLRIALAFIAGLAMIGVLMVAPTRLRRPIVAGVTFISGLFYVAWYFWPAPIDRTPKVDAPTGFVESVSFWLSDAQIVVANFSSILSGFMLGLGIYSLLTIHLKKITRRQRDWSYSVVLLVSMFAMVFFGFADWMSRLGPNGAILSDPLKWGFVNRGQDFLFDGLYQQMEAAMFSIIAFYILSAAYRAFRIRSVEATILLATALIMMLSLLGAAQFASTKIADQISSQPDAFIQNFTLTSVAAWIGTNLQTPSIRAIDFGIGLGALAMGLRLWLSLEKGNSS